MRKTSLRLNQIIIAAFCLCCLLATGDVLAGETPGSSPVRSGDTLLITGSSTMCALVADIAKRYQKLHGTVRIDVQCGGSERGIKDVREGKADIGMVSRAFTAADKDLNGYPIARDGVSIIVHKDNPVNSLSNDQIVGIFTGRVTSWDAVQGRSERIEVVLREMQKAVTELFCGYFKLKEKDLAGKVVPGDNPVTIEAVATSRRTIGYVSSGFAEHAISAGARIKILPFNNIMPTRRNIITMNYPISRPLMLITGSRPSGLAREFIDFALSSGNVDLIESYSYVPYED